MSKAIWNLHSRYLGPHFLLNFSAIHTVSWEQHELHGFITQHFTCDQECPTLIYPGGTYEFLCVPNFRLKFGRSIENIWQISYTIPLYTITSVFQKDKYVDTCWYVTVVYLVSNYWVPNICQEFIQILGIDTWKK